MPTEAFLRMRSRLSGASEGPTLGEAPANPPAPDSNNTPPPQPARQNSFSKMRDRLEGLTHAVNEGVSIAPEKAGNALSVARQTGFDQGYALENLDDLQKIVKQASVDPVQLRTSAPVTSQWLAGNPTRMAAAQDDIETLKKTEDLLTRPTYLRPRTDEEVEASADRIASAMFEEWKAKRDKVDKASAEWRSKIGFDPQMGEQAVKVDDKEQLERFKSEALKRVRNVERFISGTGKVGLGEEWDYLKSQGSFLGLPSDMLPYVGQANQAARSIELWKASKAAEDGKASEYQRDLLLQTARLNAVMNQRGKTFLAGVGSVIVGSIGFGGELATSGGVFSLGRSAAKKVGAEAVERTIEKTLQKVIANPKWLERSMVAKAIPSGIGGAAAQAAVTRSPAVAGQAVDRMTPAGSFGTDEDGNLLYRVRPGTGDSVPVAIRKAYVDQFAEVASEYSGAGFEFLDKPLANLMYGWWARRNPGKTGEMFADWLKRAQIQGTIGEMAEEEVGKGIRDVLGNEDYTLPTPEELLTEAVAFSLPGLAKAGASYIGKPTTSDMTPPSGPSAAAAHEAVAKAFDESKLRQRSAEDHKDLVSGIASNTQLSTTYIPVEAFTRYFQSAGVDPVEVAAGMGVDLAAAEKTGEDLAIDTATLHARLAGTPHAAALKNDVKYSASDLTVNETKSYEDKVKKASKEAQAEDETNGPTITPEEARSQAEQEAAENPLYKVANEIILAGKQVTAQGVNDATKGLLRAKFPGLLADDKSGGFTPGYNKADTLQPYMDAMGYKTPAALLKDIANLPPKESFVAKRSREILGKAGTQTKKQKKSTRAADKRGDEVEKGIRGMLRKAGVSMAQSRRDSAIWGALARMTKMVTEDAKLEDLNVSIRSERMTDRMSPPSGAFAQTEDLATTWAGSSEEEKDRLHLTDQVTGALNDNAWAMKGTTDLKEAIVSIDGFAWVNDAWGHFAGNDMLKYLANGLKKAGVTEFYKKGGDFRFFVEDASEMAHIERAVYASLPEYLSLDGQIIPKKSLRMMGTVAETDLEAEHKENKKRAIAENRWTKRKETPSGMKHYPGVQATAPEPVLLNLDQDLVDKSRALTDEERFKQSFRDTATGWLNKAGWDKTPRKEFVSAVDLKKLRLLNDTFGEEVGNDYIDEFTSSVVDILKTSGISDADVARTGGDEFFIQSNNPDYPKVMELVVEYLQEARFSEAKNLTGVFAVVGTARGERNAETTLRIAKERTDQELPGWIYDAYRHANPEASVRRDVLAWNHFIETRLDEGTEVRGAQEGDARVSAVEGAPSQYLADGGNVSLSTETQDEKPKSKDDLYLPSARVSSNIKRLPGTYATDAWVESKGKIRAYRKSITKPKDLAEAFGYMADKAHERFYAVVTGKDGKPLAVVGESSGGVASSAVSINAMAGEAAAVRGARQIWLVHNHPGGTNSLSKADLNLYMNSENLFAGSGIEPMGVMAITRENDKVGEISYTFKKYKNGGYVEEEGTVEGTDKPVDIDNVEVGIKAGVLWKKTITTVTEALEFNKLNPSDKPYLILINSPGYPTTIIPFTKKDIARFRDRGNHLKSWYRSVALSNAARAIIYKTSELERDEIVNLSRMMNSVEIQVVDVIDVENNMSWRTAGKDIFNSSGPFKQSGDGKPLAWTQFFEHQAEIVITDRSNPSSVMHETAHVWTKAWGHIHQYVKQIPPAHLTDIQRRYLTRADAFLKHYGVQSFDELLAPGNVEKAEQVAKDFETYLSTGEAPSVKLLGIFQEFKEWMLKIYKRVRGDVHPDVKAFFDAALATDEEITLAQEARSGGTGPLFGAYESAIRDGMTPKEAQAYQEQVDKERAAADIALKAKLKKEAESRQGPEYAEERKRVSLDVVARIDAMPAYAALKKMQDAGWGLDPGALSEKDLRDLRHSMPEYIAGEKAKKVHPTVAAETLGFDSVESMMDTFISTWPRDLMIEKLTDDAMREADLGANPSPADVTDAAESAVHNDETAKRLHMELKALAKDRTAKKPGGGPGQTPDSSAHAEPAPVGPVPSIETIRAQTERVVKGLKVNQIRPEIYKAAEVKAAKEAVEQKAKGNTRWAAAAKEREVLNHELYRAAKSAQEKITEAHTLFANVKSGKTEGLAKRRDINFVYAARAVLSDYGLMGESGKKTVAEYMELIRQYDPDTYDSLFDLIQSAEAGAGKWQEVTYSDFTSMRDAVEALWFMSRKVKTFELRGKQLDADAVNMDFITGFSRWSTRDDLQPKHKATDMDRLKRTLLRYGSYARRVRSWADMMDLGAVNGTFSTMLFSKITDATGTYRDRKVQILEKFKKIVESNERLKSREPIAAPELDYTFENLAEVLGAICHTGNNSSFDKLLRGRGWGDYDPETKEVSPARWEAFVARMWREGKLTEADYKTVQAILDLFKEVKPETQKAHKSMFGLYFKEVAPRPITTPWGTLPGGYFPAKTDSFETSFGAKNEERQSQEGFGVSFTIPTTGKGFTMKRVQQYAEPLKLDILQTASALDWQLRFAYIEPHVRELRRTLNNWDVRKAMEAYDPTAVNDMLVEWLDRAARQTVEVPSGKFDEIAKAIRKRYVMASMALNVLNTAEQYTGLIVATAKVSPKELAYAFVDTTLHPQRTSEAIAGKSAFMRHRLQTQMIDIQSDINNIVLDRTKWEKTVLQGEKLTYVLQQISQNQVDRAVWQAKYNEFLKSHSGMEPTMADDLAIQAADQAVALTQGSFNPEEVAQYEAGSPWGRLFKTFTGYFNMLGNLGLTSVQKFAKDGGFGNLKSTSSRELAFFCAAYMTTGFMCQALRHTAGGDDWDDDGDGSYIDDFLSWMFAGSLSMAIGVLPVIAKETIQMGYGLTTDKPFDDNIKLGPITAMESAVKAIGATKDLVTGDSTPRDIYDATTGLGMIFGLPIAAKPVRYGVGLLTGDSSADTVGSVVQGVLTGK